ncbi:MAG: 3-phosphoglycerate dehydrogenase [Alphaproteobacteria bacterium HGW-Alphaproteobacteria-5]|jgi:D-3-phosphoglycerate dehydrogenase|nr:MAG: 3-phosphoglycerate dehydrogenase [Alphaproteobacteria bacterium HGW-Alphaproteobacteria-5]
MSSQPRIVILGRPVAPQAMALADEAGATVVASETYLRGADLHAFLAEHRPQGVIVRLGEMTDAAMAHAPDLRIIAKHGVGYDTIDIDAAAERGILVSIAAGANAISVAEHGFALMLGVARRVAYLDARMRAGHWDKPHFLGSELYGKTLGIVGFGAIGRHLAGIAGGFGMDVVKFDPADPEPSGRGERPVASLDALLDASDVISLHCPLTSATRDMIGVRELGRMKDGAILVNTARGGLVDLDALAAALREGRIGGAGLDTFPHEPPELGDDLKNLSNLVVSPHIGASTFEAGARVGELAMRQILDAIAGRPVDPRYLVRALKPLP